MLVWTVSTVFLEVHVLEQHGPQLHTVVIFGTRTSWEVMRLRSHEGSVAWHGPGNCKIKLGTLSSQISAFSNRLSETSTRF